jgi:hypothetical protein
MLDRAIRLLSARAELPRVEFDRPLRRRPSPMSPLEEPDVVVEFDCAAFVSEDDPRAGEIMLGKREAVSWHRTYVRIDVKKNQASRQSA